MDNNPADIDANIHMPPKSTRPVVMIDPTELAELRQQLVGEHEKVRMLARMLRDAFELPHALPPIQWIAGTIPQIACKCANCEEIREMLDSLRDERIIASRGTCNV